MPFVYESSPGYYYQVSDKKTKRISKRDFEYKCNREVLKVGMKVQVLVKPYKNGKKVTGKIKKILTKKKIHTRGHKIMLEDGTVGRMVKII